MTENIFIPISNILKEAGEGAGLTIDITSSDAESLRVGIKLFGQNSFAREPVEVVVKGIPSKLEQAFIAEALPAFQAQIHDQAAFERVVSGEKTLSTDPQQALKAQSDFSKSLEAKKMWNEAANAWRVTYHMCISEEQRVWVQKHLAFCEENSAM